MSTIGDLQTIKIGGNPYSDQKKVKEQHADNRIKSTKYTLITFLPKNLLEQFRRIANFYFLVMTTIAIIIGKFMNIVCVCFFFSTHSILSSQVFTLQIKMVEDSISAMLLKCRHTHDHQLRAIQTGTIGCYLFYTLCICTKMYG